MRPHRRKGLSLLITFALSWASASAHAARTDVFSVTWLTPPACLQTDWIESEIVRLIGGASPVGGPAVFRARFAETEDGGYQLVLQARSEAAESERTVRVRSCEQLRELTVVLIAAAIDPHGADASEPPAPTQAARAPWRRRAWSLVLGALGDGQSLPEISGGPLVGGALELAPVWLWVEARYLVPRSAKTGLAHVDSSFQLLTGALGGAPTWRFGRWAVGPCAEFELGYLHGRVRGADDPTRRGSAWVAALAGGLVDRALGPRTAVQLRAQVGLPLYRQRFALAGEAPFYTTEPFTVRLWLALRVELGSKTAEAAAIQKSVSLAAP